MAYKAKELFKDKVTGKVYQAGDTYLETDEKRIAELSSTDNQQGRPLIQKGAGKKSKESVSADKLTLSHVGGGYYELSNGERVKGKKEALEAEKELRG